MSWLAFGVMLGWFASSGLLSHTEGDSPGPVDIWRHSLFTGLTAGLGVGLIPAALVELYSLLNGEFVALVGSWLGFGLIFGLPATAAWPQLISQLSMAMRHGTPVRLLRFLEDARSRGVLRTVGPIYQFRHAKLQDRLAGSSSTRRSSRVVSPRPRA